MRPTLGPVADPKVLSEVWTDADGEVVEPGSRSAVAVETVYIDPDDGTERRLYASLRPDAAS